MELRFELTELQSYEIEKLMQETGLSTRKELVNNALTLLFWAIEEVGEGNKIASVNETGHRYRELDMPVLNHAAQRAGRRRHTLRGA